MNRSLRKPIPIRRTHVAIALVWCWSLATLASAQDRSLEWIRGQDVRAPSLQVRGDYLLWWTKGNELPGLVTTSPAGTPRADAGVIGTPGTQTIFGGESIDDEVRPGGRITVSHWSGDDEIWGLEGVFFYVGDDSDTGDFFSSSPGSPILGRPFFNVTTGLEDAELVAFPNVLEGSVEVSSSSQVHSASGLLKQNYFVDDTLRIDVLGGYRYFRLRDRLGIREQLTSIDPGGLIPLGTTFDVIDQFSTENEFHGGELGITTELLYDMFSLELLAKLAVGRLSRERIIDGETTVAIPALPATFTDGGLLALPTNIGVYKDSETIVLPELGANGTVLITPQLSFVFGYSLIFLDSVARTGDQIDQGINPSQIGGQALAGASRPQFTGSTSNFWMQGLNLGLDFRW